jgi:hypothetical protein
MNLLTLESMRLPIEDQYRTFLLEEWELDLRARAKLNLARRTIEVHCHRVHDERVPLGAPLVYTFAEATTFGPAERSRMLDHVSMTINLNKLI